MRHIPLPPPLGRFLVTCSAGGCLLNKGVSYDEIGNAELLAWAHESRKADEQNPPHNCAVEDLNKVQPSKDPGAAAGAKEAAHG